DAGAGRRSARLGRLPGRLDHLGHRDEIRAAPRRIRPRWLHAAGGGRSPPAPRHGRPRLGRRHNRDVPGHLRGGRLRHAAHGDRRRGRRRRARRGGGPV
ncbi:MAG: hypothetical protein AVDCRST_MAG52-2740, partial [uncultured Blastococcus sp.]